MTRSSAPETFHCERCDVVVHPGQGDFYVIRIEAFADPTPPEFTDEDLQRDHRREIADLIARIEAFSEQELLDQVYRKKSLILCNGCLAEWIENPAGRD